jgi:prepilin-type N-terminal cleavage/methylation domain-containing protein/prepilin-type processing-associated H-X9-DG protein
MLPLGNKVCPPARRPEDSRRGFTLVELLVVIGIIALLIAILLPALNKARAQGQWAKCSSNMKQLATAFIGYTNDYKYALPWRASGTQGPRPDYNKRTIDPKFWGASDWIHWQEKPESSVAADINESAIAPYLSAKDEKLKELFRCPSDTPEQHTNRGGSIGIYKYSFTMNDRVTAANDDGSGSTDEGLGQFHKITQVKHNAEKIFLVEEKDPKDGRWIPGGIGNLLADGSADGDDALTTRHSKLANIAFFDTHIERIGNTAFKKVVNETLKAEPFKD